jgi:hypothetical protein
VSAPSFTKGPWHLWCDDRDGAFEITAALPDGISSGMLVVQRSGMPSRLEMATANARLIAAAPELYEALESVDAMFSAPGRINKNAVRDKVRVALAKARGEQ